MSRLESRGPINILALDHGLSLGWTEYQDAPAIVAQECYGGGLSGVVCHYGMVRRMPISPSFAVFMQMSGSTPHDLNKKMVAEPDDAVRADCVGVAVEFNVTGSSEALSDTAKLIRAAQQMGLLALVMVNYSTGDGADMMRGIVGATQLGADLIKVRLAAESRIDEPRCHQIIRDSPPVLVAGDDLSSDLDKTLEVAGRLGMSGSCIGRHYFSAAGRKTNIPKALKSFSTIQPKP